MSPWTSLKDIWSSAPLALEDTDVIAGSSTGGVNSKALEGERHQLTSKVKERATEEIIVGVDNFAETPPKLFTWQTHSHAAAKSGKGPDTGSPAPPTQSPLTCQDVPQWMQPNKGVWRSTPFADLTCQDLEDAVSDGSPKEQELWCNFLSQGVSSDPPANQACCFCGGGDHVEPKCSNMVWNTMQSSADGDIIDCDFIDTLSSANINFICDKFGTATFVQDGLTLRQACCACGGGEFNMNQNAGRRLHESQSLQDERKIDIIDWLAQRSQFPFLTPDRGEGSSGIPNLDYLGLGYDLARGNPRGSDTSALDPGFVHRVVRLVQSDVPTVDGAFTVPKGTDVRHIHSCKFDKSSTEVSSKREIQASLLHEASFSRSETESLRLSAGAELHNGFRSFGASSCSNGSFLHNPDVQRAAKTNARESLVAFESKAICEEYRASFIPDHDLVLDPIFEETLHALPIPYDGSNPRHRRSWADFFGRYGTSYVKDVVLGGKQVTSFSMTTEEYSSLRSGSEPVDVSSIMTFEMIKGMSASASAKKGLAKGAEAPQTNAGNDVISINLSQENSGGSGAVPNPAGDPTSIAMGNNGAATPNSSFVINLASGRAAEKISSKNLKFSEYELGGIHNADWRVWADTVPSRPMPVQYEVGSLADFMTFEQEHAADEALQDFFNTDSSEPEPILGGTAKFGVYTGLGQPLVQSTLDPNNENRVLIQVDEVGGAPITSDMPLFIPSEEPLEGECRDRSNQDYDSVMVRLGGTLKQDATDLTGVAECFYYCLALPNSGDQVGFSIALQPLFRGGLWGDPITQYATDIMCHCHYNPQRLPPKPVIDTNKCSIPIFCNLFDPPLPNTSLSYREGKTGFGLPTMTNWFDFAHNWKCYKNINYGIDWAPLHTYTDTYKGKIDRPRAIFATQIRGFIGHSDVEEDQYPYNGDFQPWKGDHFFSLSSDLNGGSQVAVTSFGQAAQEANQIPAFSFFSADSLGSNGVADDFQTGVVSPEGLILDGNQNRFNVSETWNYRVVEFSAAMDSTPDVVIFPIWYQAEAGILPTESDQLLITLGSVTTKNFSVRVNTSSPVGFNFLVIGPKTSTTNVKRGTVFHCTASSWASNNMNSTPPKGFSIEDDSDNMIFTSPKGFSIGDDDCSSTEMFHIGFDGESGIGGTHRGVLIVFDNPFREIPSVIATPVIETDGDFGFDTEDDTEVRNYPRCIVESITVSSARVKCGVVLSDNEAFYYQPIPFTFVAIGNTERERV